MVDLLFWKLDDALKPSIQVIWNFIGEAMLWVSFINDELGWEMGRSTRYEM